MRRVLLGAAATVVAGLLGACSDDTPSSEPTQPAREDAMTLTVTSPALADGETIAQQFTCDGANISPPLNISGIPPAATELALIMEDPDAPGGTFVHWVLWGMDATVTSLSEGSVPDGARSGSTSFGDVNYGGPCPPAGDPHRYIFTVYALSESSGVTSGATADDLRAAIAGSILAEGSLTGLYGR